ncbi:hypothetical protein MAA_00328 [Metarhizium robertsii ARSEF 23]|uniref:Uncharacterized protein n=1 Tax=Metarhizium robertsii (strain ARSEF 23 / ATCC MYA-3075) TaxID=655844 RepID=E9EME6_METRA|nr:uncharacterized protein MAA_00328 [Metarhizium robertsii ARSEF 23]EFZ03254.1 hypothetical protein MAA_00328 [Metarhizium robertsii ARSEF 23]
MRLLPAWLLAATACASQHALSTRMLDSIMARQQGIVDSGAASSTLESGILAQAFEYAMAQYPAAKARYGGYLSSVLDKASASFANASNITVQVSGALVRHADPATGAWWQIVTLPGVGANYLESSSTALFTFALLKALRTGLLCGRTPDYRGTALRAYNYTVGRFVTDTGNGTIGFDKTVSVCSLNSSASFEYYTTRPLVPNSLLGESAFVLAALEVERLA